VPAGGHYTWLCDPRLPPYELPTAWREHLIGEAIPDFIRVGDRRGHPDEEPWDGPSPEEMMARARELPGWRRRARGVKFQCPQCSAEGHDRHRDNAFLANDGRYGCAYAPGSGPHRRAIGEALGVGYGSEESTTMAGLRSRFLEEEE